MSERLCPHCGRILGSDEDQCPKCGSRYSSNPTYGPFVSRTVSGHQQRIKLNPDKKVGRFVIKEHLGSGSIGDVYLAEDTGRLGGTRLAVKVVEVGPNPSVAVQRLREEPDFHQRITDYNHVVRVHDLHFEPWEGSELLLLSMEFADRGTFWEWLRKNTNQR